MAARTWLAIAVLSALPACESSAPTTPDPRIPPPAGPPTTMTFQPCEYGATIAVCAVQARWGDLYASFRIVTAEGEWSSSAPDIVRVLAPGMLQAVSPSKAGYQDWVGSAIRCGRGGNGNWGSETVGPVRMIAIS